MLLSEQEQQERQNKQESFIFYVRQRLSAVSSNMTIRGAA